jgi:hypothetical protein
LDKLHLKELSANEDCPTFILKLLLSNFLYASSPDVASKFKTVCIAQLLLHLLKLVAAVKYQLVVLIKPSIW